METHRFGERLRTAINPGYEPPLFRLVHPSDTRPSQVLHKLREGNPTGGVHVQMALIRDILLVHLVGPHTFRPESVMLPHQIFGSTTKHRERSTPSRKERNKFRLECDREIRYMASCMFAHYEHLAEMSLGRGVALESVFISALFLADLAVPPQALQPLRLHLVRKIFGGPN